MVSLQNMNADLFPLKVYSQILYRRRSLNFQNLNFSHLLVTFLWIVDFPRGIKLEPFLYYGMSAECYINCHRQQLIQHSSPYSNVMHVSMHTTAQSDSSENLEIIYFHAYVLIYLTRLLKSLNNLLKQSFWALMLYSFGDSRHSYFIIAFWRQYFFHYILD